MLFRSVDWFALDAGCAAVGADDGVGAIEMNAPPPIAVTMPNVKVDPSTADSVATANSVRKPGPVRSGGGGEIGAGGRPNTTVWPVGT